MSEHIYRTDGHEGLWYTGEEIVRCKDCKRFDAKADGCWWFSHFEQMGDYSWDEMPAEVEPDGFCAWGMRS